MPMKLLATAAIALGLSGPALAGQPCLEIGQIWNWTAPDNHTLIVENDTHQKFRLSMMGYCPNLQFKERVGFQTVGQFSSLACLTRGDYVLVHDPVGPTRCPIADIVLYTPDMQKADEAAAKVKAQAGDY
jgi:hypothetical protein